MNYKCEVMIVKYTLPKYGQMKQKNKNKKIIKIKNKLIILI